MRTRRNLWGHDFGLKAIVILGSSSSSSSGQPVNKVSGSTRSAYEYLDPLLGKNCTLQSCREYWRNLKNHTMMDVSTFCFPWRLSSESFRKNFAEPCTFRSCLHGLFPADANQNARRSVKRYTGTQLAHTVARNTKQLYNLVTLSCHPLPFEMMHHHHL